VTGPRTSEQRRRRPPRRPRNDLRQYDDLADHWWRPDGAFAALHWLAQARGRYVPPPSRDDAVLVDLACGAGLMAPHVDGYRHVGVDLNHAALRQAAEHGLEPIRGDITRLPLPDAVADVVVAGEIFEHVADLEAAVSETARILKPGGTVVVDTIADNLLARIVVVHVQERLPGGPPPRIHDPAYFVSPRRLRALFDGHGVTLRTQGLKVHPIDYLRFLRDRSRPVRMLTARASLTLYQGIGAKRSSRTAAIAAEAPDEIEDA
jgi:2-polyprenyl-6-hydroxyphenyl methylase / 3-demethylubiquinone-9 3-methyltransferase